MGPDIAGCYHGIDSVLNSARYLRMCAKLEAVRVRFYYRLIVLCFMPRNTTVVARRDAATRTAADVCSIRRPPAGTIIVALRQAAVKCAFVMAHNSHSKLPCIPVRGCSKSALSP
jgi:hypothetical protein